MERLVYAPNAWDADGMANAPAATLDCEARWTGLRFLLRAMGCSHFCVF